jgi:hypothetical protein
MEDRGLQGWAADPFRLHEARYFSAGRPTKLVRDGTVESYDDPPSQTYDPPPAIPSPASAPLATAPPAADRVSRGLAAPLVNHAGGQPPGTYPGPGVPGPRVPGVHVDPEPPSKPRIYLLAAAAVAIVAGTIIGSVILLNGSGSDASPGQGQSATSAVAFVTRSAQRTLAQRTADLTLSGTITVAGKSLTVNATGQTNLSTNAMALDLRSSAVGLDEKEILFGGNLYLALSVNGKSMVPVTGRTWIRMPFQQSASANLAGSDPVASLSVLEQEGSTVQPLGTRTIGGVTCTGYAVTPSKQSMIASARAEQSSLGISPSASSQELQMIQGMTPPTITIWIDAQNLVREMSMNLQIGGVGTATSADMVMDFSHYGTPVTITAPAPSDTISWSTFLQKLAPTSLS